MSASQPGSGRLTDPEAWVDQHGDYLFRYALSRLGNRELAEDLVQETFPGASAALGQQPNDAWHLPSLP